MNSWLRFLFEPLGLVLVASATALLLHRWRRLAVTLAVLSVLTAYAAAAPALGGAWLRSTESAVPDQCADLRTLPGVILMGGVTFRAGRADQVELLSTRSLRRLVEGEALAVRHGAPLLVVSGGGKTLGVPEARLGEHLLLGMGWPAAKLKVEDRSVDTSGAAAELPTVLPTQGAIVLVSSAVHLPRAAAAFRAAGYEVRTCPVDRANLPGWRSPAGWLPQVGVLQRVTDAWYEFWATQLGR